MLMYVYTDGPSDAGREKASSQSCYPKLTHTAVAGQLDRLAIYEFQILEHADDGNTDAIYRYKETMLQDDANSFIEEHNEWFFL